MQKKLCLTEFIRFYNFCIAVSSSLILVRDSCGFTVTIKIDYNTYGVFFSYIIIVITFSLE